MDILAGCAAAAGLFLLRWCREPSRAGVNKGRIGLMRRREVKSQGAGAWG